jgi:glycosyltransferase involved in cell wall biosynthesis
MATVNFLSEVTPLVLTRNEAPNIERTLQRLTWARRIVVVDSGSTDGTQALVATFPAAICAERVFDDFASQLGYGLSLVGSAWVLVLDADHVLSEAFIEELAGITPEQSCAGYVASFDYWALGRPLRGNLYPSKTVLFRKESGGFFQDGHAYRVRLNGAVRVLKSRIFHDDRKPLGDWWGAQMRYAVQEADKLRKTAYRDLSWPDRVRFWMWPAPVLVFWYSLVWKGLILDGWAGWFYVLQRTVAEMLLSLLLAEARLLPSFTRRHEEHTSADGSRRLL